MSHVSFVALCAEEHYYLSYRKNDDYSFASNSLITPIGMHELSLIARQYPVMFMGSDVIQPIAILTTDGKRNTYIDNAGKWRRDYYVPATIQSYPFELRKIPERDAGILLFDKTSNELSFNGAGNDIGRVFTNNREPTDLLRTIVTNQTHFYESKAQAAEFAASLAAENLLQESEISISHEAGAAKQRTTLYNIHEQTYRILPSTLIEQWFKAGWVDIISLILASNRVWEQQLPAMRNLNAARARNHG